MHNTIPIRDHYKGASAASTLCKTKATRSKIDNPEAWKGVIAYKKNLPM